MSDNKCNNESTSTDQGTSASAGGGKSGSSGPKRTEEEVYDRQIRLWGADAQAKITQCKVLYVHLTGFSSEILKNLVLAGVKAVICDNRPYPEAVAGTPSFFIPYDNDNNPSTVDNDDNDDNRHDDTTRIHKKRKVDEMTVAQALQPGIEDLNPLLGHCEILDHDIDTISTEILSQFDVIVATRISMSTAIRIADALRESDKKGKLYVGDCFGYYGACCMDLGPDHMYRDDKGKNVLPPQVLSPYVPLQDIFRVPLSEAINRFHKSPPPTWVRYRSILEYVEQKKHWPTPEDSNEFESIVTEWIQSSAPNLFNKNQTTTTNSNNVTTAAWFTDPSSVLQDLANVATAELAPVCAITGGMISNEIIKVISGKGTPANNTILFDGLQCKAWTFLIQSKK